MPSAKINLVRKTAIFTKWLISLKDPVGRALITKRIERAEKGNFGDHKPVGEGIFEMRIASGPGYRIYYAQQGELIYLLTNGGNKSTQQADIEKAKAIWQQLKELKKNI